MQVLSLCSRLYMAQCQCVRSFRELVIGPENTLDKFGPSCRWPISWGGSFALLQLPLRAKAPTSCFATQAWHGCGTADKVDLSM